MSVYKVIEVIGTSHKSWSDAAKTVIEKAGERLEDLRVGEVSAMDIRMEDGNVLYRVKVKLSFKVKSFDKYGEVLGAKPYAQEDAE